MGRYAWKQGFPLDTDEEQAIETALAAAAEHHATSGGQNARVVRTPEHTAAGEYLVRVDGMT